MIMSNVIKNLKTLKYNIQYHEKIIILNGGEHIMFNVIKHCFGKTGERMLKMDVIKHY